MLYYNATYFLGSSNLVELSLLLCHHFKAVVICNVCLFILHLIMLCFRTPLHCAASSNNVEAVRLLVEHGASLMALSSYPEYETPLQKCAPDSPGFAECVLYITGMLNLLSPECSTKHLDHGCCSDVIYYHQSVALST